MVWVFGGPSNVLTLQDGSLAVGLCRFNNCEFTPKQRQLEEFSEKLRQVFWNGRFEPMSIIVVCKNPLAQKNAAAVTFGDFGNGHK